MQNFAKEYLSRYIHLSEKCAALDDTIRKLRERAESITISIDPNKVKSSPKIHDPIAEAVASMADTEKMLETTRAEAAKSMTEITKAIMSVKNDRLQLVLLLHYVNGLTWEQIAEVMSYDVRHIYRLHGIALQEVNAYFDRMSCFVKNL